MTESKIRQATIRISGKMAEDNSVPVDVLVQSLRGMQQLVYILASDAEERSVARRFRVSGSILKDYRLSCQVPEPGSYAVPLNLSAQAEGMVFDRLEEMFSSIAEGSESVLRKLFQNPGFARRALLECRNFLPNADDSWNFGYSRVGKNEITLSKKSARTISEWIDVDGPKESTTTVTGELIRIDFDDNKVFLRYPPTRQIIECVYPPEMEIDLLESRRDYIQVTGEFTLDSSGNPTKLTDVTRIEPLDLAPFLLSSCVQGTRNFILKNLLLLEPVLEPDKQIVSLNLGELGIVFAHTRSELLDELGAHFAYLWDQYAQCENDSLTADAVRLKQSVLELLEVEDYASE